MHLSCLTISFFDVIFPLIDVNVSLRFNQIAVERLKRQNSENFVTLEEIFQSSKAGVLKCMKWGEFFLCITNWTKLSL